MLSALALVVTILLIVEAIVAAVLLGWEHFPAGSPSSASIRSRMRSGCAAGWVRG